jgi:hypothetical protein
MKSKKQSRKAKSPAMESGAPDPVAQSSGAAAELAPNAIICTIVVADEPIYCEPMPQAPHTAEWMRARGLV